MSTTSRLTGDLSSSAYSLPHIMHFLEHIGHYTPTVYDSLKEINRLLQRLDL